MNIGVWSAEAAGGYEAVLLPASQRSQSGQASAVYMRRSARPSRRAVLHLDDLSRSFVPTDLPRWYNERGFHFYVLDLDPASEQSQPDRFRPGKGVPTRFADLDAAWRHLRTAEGIDGIILSAHGAAAATAAFWCHARAQSSPVGALILSSPEFSRRFGPLEIACPVLVIAGEGHRGGSRKRSRRDRWDEGTVRLGQHVTWLHLDTDLGATSVDHPAESAPDEARRRMFDEMGRWLGAYMYGQLQDRLL